MKTKNSFLLIAICAIVFSSCTIEKRRYFKGYHVEWSSHRHKAETHEEPELLAVEENQSEAEVVENASAELENLEVLDEPLISEVQKEQIPAEKNQRGVALKKTENTKTVISASVNTDPDYNEGTPIRSGTTNKLVVIAWVLLILSLSPILSVNLALAAWLLSLILSVVAAVQFGEGDTRKGKIANVVLLVLHGVLVLLALYILFVLTVMF
ncbi:MAG: hypothetical protein R2809_08665 [Flavobacteriales bacterium]